MALKRKKPQAAESSEAADTPTLLDRLTDLRLDIKGESAVTRLLDILIDDAGGDSSALVQVLDLDEDASDDSDEDDNPAV